MAEITTAENILSGRGAKVKMCMCPPAVFFFFEISYKLDFVLMLVPG